MTSDAEIAFDTCIFGSSVQIYSKSYCTASSVGVGSGFGVGSGVSKMLKF